MTLLLKVIDDIFTPDQCKDFIERAESQGLEKIDRGIAIYHRTMIIDKPLADKLYQQLRHNIPTNFNGMRVVGLNDHFRFSKYYSGEGFGIHKDGINQDSQGNRSVMTLNIFLNEDFEGGETDFLHSNNSQDIRFSAKPKTGRGALFDSQQYHRGNVVKNGCKYLLRTDVMTSFI